jgi:hypothetical protein
MDAGFCLILTFLMRCSSQQVQQRDFSKSVIRLSGLWWIDPDLILHKIVMELFDPNPPQSSPV